jgi:hypothetical protein
VGIYALYAQRKWSVSPEQVRGGLVYLAPNGSPGGEQVSVEADTAALTACQAEMRASIAAMRSALADPGRNLAEEGSFPRPPEREVCRRCPFRRPCGRI